MILASNPLFSMKPLEEIIPMVTPYFDAWELLAEDEHGWSNLEHIKDVASTTELVFQVHAPFNDVNLASINPRIARVSIKEIERSFEIAEVLDAKVVTVHPGVYSPLGRFWGKVSDRIRCSLKEISISAEDHGVICALENMPNFDFAIGVTPQDIEAFLQYSGLAFCFDIGHANTADRIDDFMDIEPANIHLHDNFGVGDEHLTLGEGNIDFKKYMVKLHRYDCNLVIEGRSIDSMVESKKYLEDILEKL